MWKDLNPEYKQKERESVCVTLLGFLIEGFVSLALKSDQGEVDALSIQQLTMFSSFHGTAMLESHDHICILYCG